MTRRRGTAFFALLASGALVLAACGGEEDPDTPAAPDETEDPVAEAPADVQVIYAAEQEFASYNNNTSDQNAFRNTHVVNRILGGFWQYGPDGLAIADEEFGTYELVSEDPQTVEFTMHPDAAWSDGNPIDCDDMLLAWAAESGYYLTDELDEAGNQLPLFSTAGTTGFEDWAKPDCNAGDKSLTAVYENVVADWILFTPDNMPAHVVYGQGGLTEDEFIEAIRNDDQAALAASAEFYNTGWIMNPGELLAEDLLPSSSQYKLESWEAGQSLTMVYNEDYWGTPPVSQTVVFRFLEQDQQAQALQNLEADIIDPQPNPDLVNQLQGMEGVTVDLGESFTYEHLDFNMRPDSVWLDREMREAFAKCVPRELIVENLIRPQSPEAQILQARLTYSFQPDYDVQIEGTPYENYNEVDIAGAAAILEANDAVGQEVRIGYFSPNPRRTNQVELIRDSCNQAGFDIQDAGSETFFGGELDQGDYDVALFAWVGSGYVSGTTSTFTTVEACGAGTTGNNFGCYSNEEVDALYTELNATLDPAAARPIVKAIEAILWEDLYTIPLFTHPSLAAWADDVTGVVNNLSQGGITWNKHQWGKS